MRRYGLSLAAALLATAALPSVAAAANARVEEDLNMRAGPSTSFPVVEVVPEEAPVTVHGCVRGYSWCDVTWRDARGWVAASYLRYFYRERYVPVSEYIVYEDVPIIGFSIDTYWNSYYRDRPWYGRRDRWRRVWRDDRREDRADRRRDRREDRAERREDRRDARADRRRERREDRAERRDDRRDARVDRRRDRGEGRAEQRERRRDARVERRDNRAERSQQRRQRSAERIERRDAGRGSQFRGDRGGSRPGGDGARQRGGGGGGDGGGPRGGGGGRGGREG